VPREESSIHQTIHQRLIQEFGAPDNTLGRDDHWALRPTPTGVALHVLVNGTGALPVVWVFDPHPRNDGVMREVVRNEAELLRVIQQIRARLATAAQGGGRCELS
jgi:hypothetical protein